MQTALHHDELTLESRIAPKAMAHEAIYDTVLGIVRSFTVGKLLDVPAGEGALAALLLHAGFDVHCCDLYPEIFRLRGVDIRRGDMGSKLPYEDSSFDYITCIEGLEHIENPQQAIREFSRVLKTTGHLIVSIPNILNIEERFKWLFHGYTSHFKPLSLEHVKSARSEFGEKVEIALHANAIPYSELRYSLEKCGFEVAKLFRDKPKSHIWLYWPMVALIRLIGKMTPAQKRRERWTDELQSDEILLGGNTLIVHAVKRGELS
ncbi:MAG: class I SAM-dependent methyltransferase [Pyrinomonadaceae bacterium]